MLAMRNLSAGHGGTPVIHGVSFSVAAGESISLLGPNGCGKTTLLRTLLGLHPADAGAVRLDGRPLADWTARERARFVAYIPQVHVGAFGHRVIEVVMLGRTAHRGLFARYTAEDRRIAREALARVGIESLAERPYTQISGGQRQLALIARALAQQARLFVMDEPVNGLDFGNQLRLLDLIRQLRDEGLTVIQTTHYPDHALYAASRVLLMHEGRVLADGPPEATMTPDHLARLYGIEAWVARMGERRFCVPERVLAEDSVTSP
ncbi:MAG: ABC transporter ATP-binding protein [Pseudomonadota bacterium]